MTLRVKVIPRSKRSEITGELADGTLKIRIATAPERGRANEALITLLAAEFGVGRESIEIISGLASGLKLVRVTK